MSVHWKLVPLIGQKIYVICGHHKLKKQINERYNIITWDCKDYNHRMNHMYHTCIRILKWVNQMCMVNHLKVGLDWLWYILQAEFVMKTNEKAEKKEKKGAHISPFSKVFVFKRFECLHKHEYYILIMKVTIELGSLCPC